MKALAKSFTAAGKSLEVVLQPGEETTYSVAGTFTGIVRLERSRKGDAWEVAHQGVLDTGFSGRIANAGVKLERYRFRIDDEAPLADPAVVVTGRRVCAIPQPWPWITLSGSCCRLDDLSDREASGGSHQTLLRCVAFDLGAFGDEAGQGQYAGAKVYSFPEGMVEFESAVIQGSVTLAAPAIDAWAGSIGLGRRCRSITRTPRT